MVRRKIICAVLFFWALSPAFSQTSLLRDYVGLINQTFHPDIVSYMEKFKADYEKRGETATVRSIDAFLKGGSGTGFVYIGPDGKNYIITNHHVITQSYSLSVTFEKQDGTKTKYEGLSILAADEDIDIALLAVPEGEKPFTQALTFLDRTVEEGEDVFSAGFPGMGNTTIWQFGRGMVSNARVSFPAGDDTDTMMGPYIQHTAQVDPGNSGGPLLVQTQGVLSGYAIGGINTLSARYRQAANFSIPMERVRSFIERAFSAEPVDQQPRLEARVNSFLEGMDTTETVYDHIAKFLSNNCVAENAEYAIGEVLRRAPRKIENDIGEAFSRHPVDGMGYAVAWTIENTLRSSKGNIAISLDNIAPNENQGYTVTFKVNEGVVSSEWINEYGIWRIRSFGRFAAGDKTYINQAAKEREEEEKLKTSYMMTVSAGYAHIPGRGPAFTTDITLRPFYFGLGFRSALTRNFIQVEGITGVYFPIRIQNTVAFTPFGDLGLGFMIKSTDPNNLDAFSYGGPDFGLSLRGGLQITTKAVPGLFLQAAYQYNAYISNWDEKVRSDPHILSVSIGYGF
jgi:serine protease Do